MPCNPSKFLVNALSWQILEIQILGCDILGGLLSPDRTVTPVGTTIVRMAGGATCIVNASNTTLAALSRIFCLIKVVNL
jgi:hypothetical protein